jgi:hypothetical protein
MALKIIEKRIEMVSSLVQVVMFFNQFKVGSEVFVHYQRPSQTAKEPWEQCKKNNNIFNKSKMLHYITSNPLRNDLI